MKHSVIGLVVSVLATLALAQDAKPSFEFVKDPVGRVITVDTVKFPYTEEGADKQCIHHPEPIQGVSVTQKEYQEYCYYGFLEAGCGGVPDIMRKVDMPSGLMILGDGEQQFKSSVIRKGSCPDEVPDLIPAGETRR